MSAQLPDSTRPPPADGAGNSAEAEQQQCRPQEQAKANTFEGGMVGWVAPSDWKLLSAVANYHHPDMRLYRRGGVVVTSFGLASGSVEHLAKFQARPSDIVVSSFPKSGTTWLEEVVWRITNGKTGPSSGDGTPLEFRVPMIEYPSTQDMLFQSIHEMESPRLLKTHLPYSLLPGGLPNSGAKLLYITRDARDVCVSYYHFCRMVRLFKYRGTFHQFLKSFMRDEVLYGPYRKHVRGYLEHADTVLCVTYEQMHSDRPAIVRKVAAFLGQMLTDEDVQGIVRYTTFDVMRNSRTTNFRQWERSGMIANDEEGTFMRKGQVGDWKNYFTEEENESFMKWLNEEVEPLNTAVLPVI